MKKIEGELTTQFQKDVAYYEGKFWEGGAYKFKKEWQEYGGNVNRVRASEGFPVATFRELINYVAEVTINNKTHEMFYRGQAQDYLNNQAKYYNDRKQKSVVFPTICRPELKEDGTPKYSIQKKVIDKRYRQLYAFIDFVSIKWKRRYREEHIITLLQHYEILPTPLIDITQSLRVAATFALMKNQQGYIYVFGLPYPNQSISYYVDLEMILLKLQNMVGTNALRPRYQEGYLVGKFPFHASKSESDNLASRMVAKFKIDNTNGQFWDAYFLPMPKDILFPEEDTLGMELQELWEEFRST